MLATADIFGFEEFRLDRRGDGLSRRDQRGQFVPVAIGPRALDVPAMLVERAITLVEYAIRLSPRDPAMGRWYTWIGFVHLLQPRVDEAIAWLEKAKPRSKSLEHASISRCRLWLERRARTARAELAEAKRLVGSDRYFERRSQQGQWRPLHPALRDQWETVYFPGIRAAGQPEE